MKAGAPEQRRRRAGLLPRRGPVSDTRMDLWISGRGLVWAGQSRVGSVVSRCWLARSFFRVAPFLWPSPFPLTFPPPLGSIGVVHVTMLTDGCSRRARSLADGGPLRQQPPDTPRHPQTCTACHGFESSQQVPARCAGPALRWRGWAQLRNPALPNAWPGLRAAS